MNPPSLVVVVFAAAATLAPAVGLAQDFELAPGDLEYRIVVSRGDVGAFYPPEDRIVQLALQARYVGGDDRVASLAASRGRIVSGEADSAGILTRPSVRQFPFGNNDFGVAARQGMTNPLRELFAGGVSNNNADENGGNPNAASAGNPFNGGGEFRHAPGLAGFGTLHAFDNVTNGIGRTDSGDAELISVGLVDDNNGTGDDTGIEPTLDQSNDTARWDTIFLFTYTPTTFENRLVSFDYEVLGSPQNPGDPEDSVHWWDSSTSSFRRSNAVPGIFRDDLSDNIYVFTIFPAPGAAGLLALGGVAAARRRRA